MPAAPRVVVVTRKTEYELLLERHGTRGQAGFFLSSRGQTIEEVESRHHLFHAARHRVLSAIPLDWRQARVGREDLSRFLFEPSDVVVAVGQDGLVANVAKYLEGQRVVGINPDRSRHDGILVPHPPDAIDALLGAVAAGRCEIEARTMVEARLDDGQRLLALNEVYLGHRTHQSSRYVITHAGASERQSSSGVIVTTGTGATGWARSIHRQRRTEIELPAPTDRRLSFFVREAFPSVATGTGLTEGDVSAGEALRLRSEMNDDGVLFGDGIEEDRLSLRYGMTATVTVAPTRLQLVR